MDRSSNEKSELKASEKNMDLVLSQLEFLREHKCYKGIEIIERETEKLLNDVGLYTKWVHENLGQNLHDRNAAFRLAQLPRWKEEER